MANFFFDPSGDVIPGDIPTLFDWFSPDFQFDPSIFDVANDPGGLGSFTESTFFPSGVPAGAIPQYDSSGNIVGYYTTNAAGNQSDLFGPTGTFEGSTDLAAPENTSIVSRINSALGTNMTGSQMMQFGLGLGSLGLGLGGALSSLFGGGGGGGAFSSGTTSTTHTQLTPQQQAAQNAALQALQQINNIALTGPTGVANVIGGMVAPSQQAYNQSLGLLGTLAPQYMLGASPLQQAQNQILNPLSAYTGNLLSGNMQIPPALKGLVEQAYQGQVDDAVKQAIIGARNQGFAGGADLLMRAPASGGFGAAMSDISSKEAAYLLDLMTKTIPQTAGSVAQQYNQPITTQGNFVSQFLNPQIQAGQTGVENQLKFLQAATAPNTALGALGTSGTQGGATSGTQETKTPSTFSNLASLLGALGGAIGPISQSLA